MSPSNSRKPRGGPDLTLFGISDTELLHIVDDLADENGWTSTLAVREQLGEKPGEADYVSGCGSRLSWMSNARADERGYGWLERSPDTGDWRLTAMGQVILDNPDLTRTIQTALDKLNPAQRLKVAREIAENGRGSADEIRYALRRQWMRAMGR